MPWLVRLLLRVPLGSFLFQLKAASGDSYQFLSILINLAKEEYLSNRLLSMGAVTRQIPIFCSDISMVLRYTSASILQVDVATLVHFAKWSGAKCLRAIDFGILDS